MLASLPTSARASLPARLPELPALHEDRMPAFELVLTPSQVRRLRAVLVETFEDIEYHRRTMPKSHVGYHGMLDDLQSDLFDVYEQMVCARSGSAERARA